jgi:hypothetical protein
MDQLSADNAATSPANELTLEPPVTKGTLSKLLGNNASTA